MGFNEKYEVTTENGVVQKRKLGSEVIMNR